MLDCDFGAVKLLTSLPSDYEHVVVIPRIGSLEAYSEFIVRELFKHIDTSHCLIVQYDGWVCNASRWQADWLAYDYVGGVTPWTEEGPEGKGGNGGFSLRSRRLLEAGAGIIAEGSCHPEDWAYSSTMSDFRKGKRDQLEHLGMSFAPRRVQQAFCNEKGRWAGEFGHHQGDLSDWSGPEAVHPILLSDIEPDQEYLYYNDREILWQFTLAADGTIRGPHHDNESYWEFIDGELRFLDKGRSPRTSFSTRRLSQRGEFIFCGSFLDHVNHYLTPVRRTTAPEKAPPRMHLSQYGYMRHLIQTHFKAQPGAVLHDVGSYDVNGSHKPIAAELGLGYVGGDIAPGPNVDVVFKGHYDWSPFPEKGCDFIISGSCLEHVQAPWLWAAEAFKRLRTGGFIAVIMPFKIGEHRYPVDCYRILPDGLEYLFCNHAGFIKIDCGFSAGNNDTYFVGIKL